MNSLYLLIGKYKIKNNYLSIKYCLIFNFLFADGFIGNMKRKRAHMKDVRDRNILGLYNKLHELVGLVADLLSIQTLTDTTVLQLSSLGVAPFFVENVAELQLSSLRLVTQVNFFCFFYFGKLP